MRHWVNFKVHFAELSPQWAGSTEVEKLAEAGPRAHRRGGTRSTSPYPTLIFAIITPAQATSQSSRLTHRVPPLVVALALNFADNGGTLNQASGSYDHVR